MDHLSLESLKEPSPPSNGLTSRRHTMSHEKVPARTQAAIEKVAEVVNKMGGQVRTHIQDNGGIYIPLLPSPKQTNVSKTLHFCVYVC